MEERCSIFKESTTIPDEDTTQTGGTHAKVDPHCRVDAVKTGERFSWRHFWHSPLGAKWSVLRSAVSARKLSTVSGEAGTKCGEPQVPTSGIFFKRMLQRGKNARAADVAVLTKDFAG